MTSRPDLQMAFELASLRQLMADIRLLPEPLAARLWQRARQTMEIAEADRRKEVRLHSRYFGMRVEAQMKAIRDDDKAPHRDFEPEGYGGAKFDERAVRREARRRVEYGHQMRLAELDRQERDSLQALREEARVLRMSGKAARDFNGASRVRKRGRRRGMRREWDGGEAS